MKAYSGYFKWNGCIGYYMAWTRHIASLQELLSTNG